ncbi:MAG: CocE/NonD family hydrolase [Anaerolineales bacterium]
MEGKKEHEVWTDYNLRVPMRDGVELSADVYRPMDSKNGERYPAILLRTPYNKTAEKSIETARWFAARGYAVIWMDVRGRGDSDGAFSPYRNDGRDGYDAIEWCAAQAWSTGKVGTLGGSYLGHIQWLAALQQPPHLATMVALVSPSDPFVEWPTGTHGPMHICWTHMTSGRVLQNAGVVDWMKIYEHLPLMSMDERAGRFSPAWREDFKHTQLDEYWEPLRYQNKFEQINLPVMHISGWYDDEQIGTPLNYVGMTTRGGGDLTRQNQKLLMGPWGHQVNTQQKLGEVDFGPDALIDLRGEELAWFDYWLKDRRDEPVAKPPVGIFVMGENKWRDEQEWPLARTHWTKYYLHSGGSANSRFGDGRLATREPGDEPGDRYHYDPARPVPFITEPTSSQIGGPDDYAAVERRDDVLVYVTPPLEEDLEITGPVKLTLYAASSARDTDFMAKLVDVQPTGFVQRLCDGMVRARFRNGMERPELIEPDKIYAYQIDLWNTSQVFFKGHRIGLEVSSSAFPKYDRNLNTGEDLGSGTRMLPAKQMIYHDRQRPSVLVLPVIPR